MHDSPWRQHIHSDASIHHGEPVIKGTRVAVSVIVANLSEMTPDEMLVAYPQLTREDLKAALLFASECARSTLVSG